STLMTAAEKYALDNGPEQYEEYSNSSNLASTPTSIRSNYDKNPLLDSVFQDYQ
ncbi:40647_t:CDS:2, partial [Gigaspora margarita]